MEHPFFPASTRFESLRLLSLAETHLSNRDLSTSKTLATRARETDPSTLELANQLLAVTDTLLSYENKIANNRPDYYSILNLSPHNGLNNNAALISEHFKKSLELLYPDNNKYPLADVAFRAVLEAYDVLSDPVKKAGYDKEIAFYLQQQRVVDPFSFRIPTVDQNLLYFGGANAAIINGFRSGFRGNLGSSGTSSGNCVQGFSAFVSSSSNSNVVPVVDGNGTNVGVVDRIQLQGGNGTNVGVVDGIQQGGNGTHTFMGILGMNHNNVSNHVQEFTDFVSSGNSVPVVEGNQQGGNGTQSFVGVLGMNDNNVGNNDQDFTAFVSSGNSVPVVEGNVMNEVYVNVGEINSAFMNVVDEDQGIVKETNGDYANAVEENKDMVKETNVELECSISDDISFPEVNITEETHDGINGAEVNVDVEEVVEEGKEESGDDGTGNGGVEGTFWTACPYCCCMFEYPGVYADSCLRCVFCKSAFQGVAIASPPPIVKGEDGKEGYYCCWSFFPVGIRGESWDKLNEGSSGWTPFSPMFAAQGIGRKERGWQNYGPRVYVEDEDDEAWMESSESEEFDDVDWNKEYKKRKVLNKRVTRSAYKIAQKVQVDICSEKKKKIAITPSRMQPSRVAKKSGQE